MGLKPGEKEIVVRPMRRPEREPKPKETPAPAPKPEKVPA